MKVLHLATPGHLSQCTYLEAAALIREAGDLPMMLVAARKEAEAMAEWLWENHRITAVMSVPAELLCDESAWALMGHNVAVVVSDGR